MIHSVNQIQTSSKLYVQLIVKMHSSQLINTCNVMEPTNQTNPESKDQPIEMGRGKPADPLNNPAFEELRQKARLYTSGGGVHYGIPPEERANTKYWNK